MGCLKGVVAQIPIIFEKVNKTQFNNVSKVFSME